MVNRSDISVISREIVEEFAFFDDWMGRYEHLIDLGKELPLIEEGYRTDEFRIKGCQSQVWLHPEFNSGRVYFSADSDAFITKGLIALLIRLLDGRQPDEIIGVDLSFLEEIGMVEHLSPSRKNGLEAMIKQIKLYAIAYSTVNENKA